MPRGRRADNEVSAPRPCALVSSQTPPKKSGKGLKPIQVDLCFKASSPPGILAPGPCLLDASDFQSKPCALMLSGEVLLA
jgi:hypothetical protein